MNRHLYAPLLYPIQYGLTCINMSALTIFFWSPGSLWVNGGYVFPFRIKVHISITATKQAMTNPAAKTQKAPAKFSRVNSP